MNTVSNLRIESFTKITSPYNIRLDQPASNASLHTIEEGREGFTSILNESDNRFVVIVGPCSIHDEKFALEYAEKLNNLKNNLGDRLFIMMRVYFEKPRTTIGWKGLINDPDLNGSNNMEKGLKMARKILLNITGLGLPVASELLDPITAAYIGELVSWVAIGARTTESQTHRQMASGLSAPVGFKNNADGNLDVAINAMQSSRSSHSFMGIDDDGSCSIVKSNGNQSTHVVLRGGKGKSNYHAEDIKICESILTNKGFTPKIIVDCSHENSDKDYKKQNLAINDIIAQRKSSNKSIFGVMLESNLFEGNQKVSDNIADLKYGVSITDSCIGWEETEEILRYLHDNV